MIWRGFKTIMCVWGGGDTHILSIQGGGAQVFTNIIWTSWCPPIMYWVCTCWNKHECMSQAYNKHLLIIHKGTKVILTTPSSTFLKHCSHFILSMHMAPGKITVDYWPCKVNQYIFKVNQPEPTLTRQLYYTSSSTSPDTTVSLTITLHAYATCLSTDFTYSVHLWMNISPKRWWSMGYVLGRL